MNENTIDFSARNALAGVDDVFVKRWSPRSFSQEPVAEDDLARLFDACRWSPSAYNEQPWRFYTSTAHSYDRFLGLLVDANQAWASTAPVIGFVVAQKQFTRNGKHNPHAVFDTGAAWMALNLQASLLGYHVHGMAGIHYDEVYRELNLDADACEVICGFALGRVNPGTDEEITARHSLDQIWVAV